MAEKQVYGFTKPTADRLLRLADSSGGSSRPKKPTGKRFEDSPEAPILFRNDSGETAPAFGIMRVTGYVEANGRDMVTITKPTTTFGTFLFNCQSDVADDEYGYGYIGPFVRALYDSGDTPTNGNVYGVDGWKLKSSGYRLLNATMLGIVDSTNKVAFVRTSELREMIPVAMSQTGGSDGDATTKTTYTYTITDAYTTASIGTSVDPEASPHKFKRLAAGHVTAATFGTGYWKADGAFSLVHCNEIIVVESC